MRFHNVFRDRQANAHAAGAARGRDVRLLEALEDARQEVRGDADSLVAHGDLQARADPLRAHLDAPARVGKLDGVGYEVAYHLAKPRLVATHEAPVLIDVIAERDGARVRHRAHLFEHLLD